MMRKYSAGGGYAASPDCGNLCVRNTVAMNEGHAVHENELMRAALDAARFAAGVHREHAGRVNVEDWSEKGTSDFVTFVDRQAEDGIIERLRRQFPDHAILAEESDAAERGAASTVPTGGWTWVIDPLDGTTNFLHGYPMYAVSIGVTEGRSLEAAVVINTATGDEWTAVRGHGAHLNGNPIAVSETDRLARSLIGTGFPFKTLDLMPSYLEQFDRVLRATSGVRRAGSAALDLCHLATGWFDGFWEQSLAPWDVAAGALIAREAGGLVTRPDGSDDVVGHGPILAGNPTIHRLLGRLLRGEQT